MRSTTNSSKRAGERTNAQTTGTHPADPKTLVTLSQIAELAGVGPPAVSNWRKRFEDFPQPMGSDTGGRAVFSLEAIEIWLYSHRRSMPKVGERLLFQAADILRAHLDIKGVTEALCSALTLLHTLDDRHALTSTDETQLIREAERRDPSLASAFEALEALDPGTRKELLTLVSRLDRSAMPEVFELALTRLPRFTVARTSGPLVKLLVRLGLDESPHAIDSVYDPAAGEGNLLLAAARAAGDQLEVVGQELDQTACLIARQRAHMWGLEATLSCSDGLLGETHWNVSADLVLCDPPYGVRPSIPIPPAIAQKKSARSPTLRTTDYAWLRRVVSCLSPTGRGYILLPLDSLSRNRAEAEERRNLLESGAVEAIVALPPRAAEHTAIALALWILRSPSSTDGSDAVLLVEGANPARNARRPLDEDLIERIALAVRTWRRRDNVRLTDDTFAVGVPIVTLPGAKYDLNPARWTATRPAIANGQRRRLLEQAVASLNAATKQLSDNETSAQELWSEASATWVSLADLYAEGRVELIRGSRIDKDALCQTGTRLLRPRDVQSDKASLGEAQFVDLQALTQIPRLTSPGDILISALGGQVHAIVDETGGSVLSQHVQAVRLNGAWIDRRLAARFLENARNQRLARPRPLTHIDIRDLQLPIVAIDEANGLAQALKSLESAEALGLWVREAAREAREVLLDLESGSGEEKSQESHSPTRIPAEAQAALRGKQPPGMGT